jgi:hypothetical protein
VRYRNLFYLRICEWFSLGGLELALVLGHRLGSGQGWLDLG